VSPTRAAAHLHAVLDELGHVALEPLAEVLEHGGAARQDHVGVEPAAAVDGALEDRLIHHLGERLAREGRNTRAHATRTHERSKG
jgi:hypothetical protein